MPMPTEDLPCPLCDSPALMHPTDYGKCRNFVCPKCKEFYIIDTAERLLGRHPELRTRYASLARKGSDDNFLMIYRLPIEADKPTQLGARFLARSEVALFNPGERHNDA